MLTRQILLLALWSIIGLTPAIAAEKPRFTHPGVRNT
jgi:hypothetical protein